MLFKNIRFWSFVNLVLLLIQSAAHARSGERVNFLSRGPGATAQGMGEAFTATADDLTAIYHNPAGLTFQQGAFYAEHTSLFDGGRYNFVGFHYPTTQGSFGFGAIQLATGGIAQRRSLGDSPTEVDVRQTAYFLPYSNYWKNISYGVTLKKIDYDLAGYRDSTYGADVGFLRSKILNDFRYISNPTASLGFTFRNLLQPTLHLIDDQERFPREIKAGAAISGNIFGKYNTAINELVYDRLTFAFDALKPESGSIDFMGGIEYSYRSILSFRVGLNDNFALGLGYGNNDSNYHLDYSMNFTALMPQHKFSFSYKFSDPRPRPSLEPKLRKYKLVQLDRLRYRDRFLTRGKKYLEDRQYESALSEVENALILDPFNEEIKNLLARTSEGNTLNKIKVLLDSSREAISAGNYQVAVRSAFEAARTDSRNKEVVDYIPNLRNQLISINKGSLKGYKNIQAEFYARISKEFAESMKKRDIPHARLLLEQAKVIYPDGEVYWGSMGKDLHAAEEADYGEYVQLAHQAMEAGNYRQAYVSFLYARDIEPENRPLFDQIRSFEAGYAQKMKFSSYDKLYHEQMYYLAAIDYVKGDLNQCLEKLDGLLQVNVIQREANFLRKLMVDKFMVDRTGKF